MAKRILILTDSIAPPAYAPRIVSLCRYLSGKGHLCTVFSDCEQGVEPYRADQGEWYHTAYYQHGNTHLRYLADKVFGARERQFMAYIERTVQVANYDAIFCSTCYYFPLQTACRLAHKYRKPLTVDLRDIAEQFGNMSYRTHSVAGSRALNDALHRLYTRHHLRQRNRVLAAAKQVVTISPWHRELLSRYNPHTELIYNGFDAQEFYPKDVPSEQFVISYAGKIYDLRFRDPRLLMEALQQLFADGRMKREDINLRFHIDQASMPALQQMVAGYGLSDICHIEGYIPKSELLPLMHRSSILLVLTCLSTPEGAHGIMGTKFYEALGVEKPVLCIRSDEECLAQVVRETKAGLAGTHVDEVATFLMDKYREWKQKGYTRQVVQNKEQFSREYQSARLEEILTSQHSTLNSQLSND